jgi:type-2 restriction enzyme nlaIV
MNASDIYNKLLDDDKILSQKGEIKFNFANISITVKQKDVIGNIIQEWLAGWLSKNKIPYLPNPNSQMPPDFFLNPQNKTTELLEVKAFNKQASPAFDIADFRMYSEEILKKPYMLNVDYLIFGYEMSNDGIVTIKGLWNKKVWQITRAMQNWALNLQIKQNVVHKIRPCVWYSDRGNFPPFENLEDFVAAIEETVYQNPKTHNEAANWKKEFLKNYKKHYGQELVIPRWIDIKNKYAKA